jgi:NADPH-dependent 2,4-dienoyl-CoA reductase/sulfur reductase-like enzyme/peroxiredoxin family protein/TusA-related sulfurtransferase/rhodanese-related sulfurtransferase
MKICIIGGVAAGASAATRLRRLDESAEIVLFEKGDYISYANCGMPYYLGRQIESLDTLIVTKPERLIDRFNVDVRIKTEVLSIDRAAHKLTVRNLANGKEYEETYDKLILTPGAKAKKPPVPGVDEEGIFTLRSITDMIEIDGFIKAKGSKRALVVGGGFIGVEMAENLKRRGLSVALVEFMDQILAPLDLEMANVLHKEMIENGVDLRLSTGVTGFAKNADGSIEVSLNDGTKTVCDIVILSLGVTPEAKLAQDAGLESAMAGTIKTDDRFRTSDPDIYAAGDVISVINGVSGSETLVQLGGPASKQGRGAADDICGSKDVFGKIAYSTSVVKVYDYTAASTGMNEKQLKAEGIPYKKTYATPPSHASYYPNAKPITMKLLFGEDGKVLGAQAVGQEHVDKQIDVIATVIQLGGTVRDLERLELGYGPAYNSAKSNVNMLGFVASNILDGITPTYYVEDIPGLDPATTFKLDVSTPDEILMSGVMPGAVSIPLDELRGRLDELPKDKTIYVNCHVGQRGYIAQRLLLQHGFKVYNLAGGSGIFNLATMDLKKVKEKYEDMQKRFGSAPAAAAPKAEASAVGNVLTVDACGLACPGPIMKVSEGIKQLPDGGRITVRATDPAFASDIDMWCTRTGNTILDLKKENGIYTVVIQKGTGAAPAPAASAAPTAPVSAGNDKTMVIFDGDLDKAIAAFIIANGAAAMDRKVTMFFTFWGLNILRKDNKVDVEKTLVEKMFGAMMPRGSKKLSLSKMNMAGMGGKMIRGLMNEKNITSLEDLIKSAVANGVHLVACQMSMDMMGIKAEELIDGVEFGGVATMLGAAETSDTTFFI